MSGLGPLASLRHHASAAHRCRVAIAQSEERNVRRAPHGLKSTVSAPARNINGSTRLSIVQL